MDYIDGVEMRDPSEDDSEIYAGLDIDAPGDAPDPSAAYASWNSRE